MCIRDRIQAFQRVMKKRPKAEPFVIDGRSNFLFVNHKGKPKVAICMTELTLPNSVTSIGDGAFGDCSGLSKITSLAEIPPVCGSGVDVYKRQVLRWTNG